MTLVERLLAFLNKSQNESETPEGFCPNCWGRAEYGGKFYEAVKNNQTNIDDKDPQVGWVQDYANKHLLDIQLVNKDDEVVCPKCTMSYRPS